jgi:diguanylate cyclase (GGDEF)-like protein
MPPITAQQLADGNSSPAPDIRSSLRQLNRKNWWQWWNAVLVITLLMGMIVVLSLPRVFPENDPSFHLELTSAIRGLLGLVLIFNVYTLYQQHLLKQLRDHLAGQIEITTEQRVRAETLYELAILDPLTGLYNRRHCEERLKAEIARADRYGLPLIVILFDTDKFKLINDRFGHPAGDVALKEFARRLGKAIRGSDSAVRMGGDEFLAVLPECPPEQVGVVLSRLAPFEIDLGGQKALVSSSSGWVQYEAGETAEQLIARADEALYAQKVARYSRPTSHDEILA